MATPAPPVPPALRQIAHYVNIANENVTRDPVVYYWCLYYAVQSGMPASKESQDALKYLTALLSNLEKIKKQLAGQEAITQDMVAQAHIENFAMKLFEYADKNDRQSNFSKSVIKAFYTAGYLIDVLTLFGELDESLVVTRKYAKWKAAYICNCLKKGETPVPGPADGQNESETNLIVPPGPKVTEDVSPVTPNQPTMPGFSNLNPDATAQPQSSFFGKPTAPARDFSSLPAASSSTATSEPGGSSGLTMEDYLEAQKYAKYAVSALSYEDAKTAIENMEKAMAILKSR